MSFGRDPMERFTKDINDALRGHEERIRQIAAAQESLRRHLSSSGQSQHANTEESVLRLQDHESHYANTILLLGYGGFFALWANTAGNMPKGLFGLSGLLMGTSLVLFILFELAKTVASSLGVQRGYKRKLNAADTVHLSNRYLDAVQVYWLHVFIPTVLAGLLAGGIVLWHFGAHALNSAWTPPPPPATESPAAKPQGAPAKI